MTRIDRLKKSLNDAIDNINRGLTPSPAQLIVWLANTHEIHNDMQELMAMLDHSAITGRKEAAAKQHEIDELKRSNQMLGGMLDKAESSIKGIDTAWREIYKEPEEGT